MKLGQLVLFYLIFFLFTSCGSGSKFGSDISITVRNKSSLSALSLSQSKVTVSQSEIALNNSLKVTVTLLTNSGTPFISDAVTVALTASGGTSEGTLSSVTSVGDGVYEATFTGTVVGSAITISSTVNDKSLTSTFPSITVVPGSSSVATSTVSVSSSTVVSGSSVTVTLRAKDSAGNNLTKGGLNVAFSRSGGASTGTFSTVKDNSDGTYTATFTGVVAGSATTITATIEGASIVSSLPTVTVSAGSYTLDQSSLTATASSVSSGAAVTITLTVKDLNGNQLPGGGLTVLFSASGGTSTGTLGAVVDHLDGTYSTTFTGTTSGTAKTISATIEGNTITSTLPTISVSTGVYTLAQSTVSVAAATVTSGSSVLVTLRAKDVGGNQLASGGLVVTFTASGGTSTGTWSAITDNNNGTYTASFTGVTAGSATTIGATIAGQAVTSSLPTETVTVGAPASITISGGGNNQSDTVGTLLGTVLNVVVKDANNNLLSGINVDWSVTAGGGSLSLCTATTNASGVSNCSYTLGTTPGANTITATVNGTAITTTFSETATIGAVSKLLFVQQPSNTASGTTISPSITVRATDSYGNTVTSYATNIDIAIDTNPSTGTLSGTTSQAPASGVATFNNLSINYNGTGYKLIASSAALTTATSSAFNITASSVSYDWPFDAGSEASYTIASGIDLTGGVARLTPSDQTDDENTTSYGFLTGTPYGLSYGTLSDGTTSGLKFANANGCNALSYNCSSFDSTWTPKWSSLLAYWKLDEAAGSGTVADSSPNGTYTGTNSNVTLGGSGAVNTSAAFNGSSSIISTNYTQTAVTAYSIQAWVKTSSSSAKQTIVENRGSSGTSGISLTLLLGQNGCLIGSAGTVNFMVDSDNLCRGIHTTATVNDGIWHHIIGTWSATSGTSIDPAQFKIYIDGVLQSVANETNGGTTSPLTGLDGLKIGRHYGWNTYFNGSIDEVAIWNSELTSAEVATIYNRQSPKFSGNFTSRIMNGLNATSAWTTLSWLTTLPFGKELPDAACPVAGTPCAHTKSENSTSYSSLVGSTDSTSDNNLMSGIVGLWHMNESSWNNTADEVVDDSGTGKHGSGVNGATTSDNAIFYKSGYFDGTNDYITLPSMTTDFSTNGLTLSIWAKPTSSASYSRFFDIGAGGSDNIIFGRNSTESKIFYQSRPGGGEGVGRVITNAGVIENNVWHHYAAVSSATGYVIIYKDGVNVYQVQNNVPNAVTRTTPYIAKSNFGDAYFKGYLDEAAIWNRALTPTEIKQLYLRGAARLKLQVRSCDDNACSGETWKGPDGTNGSYFSELNNNSTPYSGSGNVNPTPPSLVLANFTAAPSTNQYFQYRIFFEALYSLPTPSFMPELKSVTVDPVHYNSSSSAIYGASGLSYYSLVSLAETPGAGGCPSGITYNVSTDKINWKYWDGAAWSLSGGTAANSNSASVITTNASTFPHAGVAYIKALLNSTGSSKCEIDGLHLRGQN